MIYNPVFKINNMMFGVDSEYNGNPEEYTEDIAKFSGMISDYGTVFEEDINVETTENIKVFMASVSYFIAQEFNKLEFFTKLLGDLNFGTRQNQEFLFNSMGKAISSKKLAKSIYNSSLEYISRNQYPTADRHCYVAYVAMVCSCNFISGNNFESSSLVEFNTEYINYLKNSGSFNAFFEANRRFMSTPRFGKYYDSIGDILFGMIKSMNRKV